MVRWTPGMTLWELKDEVYCKAIEYYKTRTMAAKMLGISLRALRLHMSTHHPDLKRYTRREIHERSLINSKQPDE